MRSFAALSVSVVAAVVVVLCLNSTLCEQSWKIGTEPRMVEEYRYRTTRKAAFASTDVRVCAQGATRPHPLLPALVALLLLRCEPRYGPGVLACVLCAFPPDVGAWCWCIPLPPPPLRHTHTGSNLIVHLRLVFHPWLCRRCCTLLSLFNPPCTSSRTASWLHHRLCCALPQRTALAPPPETARWLCCPPI